QAAFRREIPGPLSICRRQGGVQFWQAAIRRTKAVGACSVEGCLAEFRAGYFVGIVAVQIPGQASSKEVHRIVELEVQSRRAELAGVLLGIDDVLGSADVEEIGAVGLISLIA